MRGFIPPRDAQETLLFKRVAELAGAVRGRGVARTTGFLSDREQELARAALSKAGFDTYRFEGGAPQAERKVLCLFEEEANAAAPIECLCAKPAKNADGLCHRANLGALLSLGIKRECVGDILVQSGKDAFIFVLETVAGLVCEELTSVGRCAVKVQRTQPDGIEEQPQPRPERTASVASLRLDAVLAAMMKLSRGDAARLIESGGVEVNHIQTDRTAYEVFEDDVFSVRGKGKFRLCAVGGQSKKGRTFVSYIEY